MELARLAHLVRDRWRRPPVGYGKASLMEVVSGVLCAFLAGFVIGVPVGLLWRKDPPKSK